MVKKKEAKEENKEVKEEAKKILDAFMKELEKIPDKDMSDRTDEEENKEEGVRDTVETKDDKAFPDKFVSSLSKKKGRELQAEKKSW